MRNRVNSISLSGQVASWFLEVYVWYIAHLNHRNLLQRAKLLLDEGHGADAQEPRVPPHHSRTDLHLGPHQSIFSFKKQINSNSTSN